MAGLFDMRGKNKNAAAAKVYASPTNAVRGRFSIACDDSEKFADAYLRWFASELRSADAGHVSVVGTRLVFRKGMFRFTPPFNLLRYVRAGEVTVVPNDRKATIQFDFQLVELAIPSSVGIASALGGLAMTDTLWRWIFLFVAIGAALHVAMEYVLASARISKALRSTADRVVAVHREPFAPEHGGAGSLN